MLPKNLRDDLERLLSPFTGQKLTDENRGSLTEQANEVLKSIEHSPLMEHANDALHRFSQGVLGSTDEFLKSFLPPEAETTTKENPTVADLNITPLDDRIVLEPVEADEKTAGGILLPDTAKQRPQQGKVIAVGPGKLSDDGSKRTPVSVKIGDIVFFARYGGSEVELKGKDYKILRESGILAKIG